MTISKFSRKEHTSLPVLEKFWARVDKSGDCWIWLAGRTSKFKRETAYGVFPNKVFGSQTAHRVSYEIHYGPIPDGLFVCHKCDNPPCVNPEHLFLGTLADNAADMAAKGRAARNYKLTPEMIADIKAAYAVGNVSQGALARRFRVSAPLIARAIRS